MSAPLAGTPPERHPNLFVRGLPLDWGESDLTSVFSRFGTLTSVRLVRHGLTKHSLGYGFVRFQDVSEAEACIQGLDGTAVALGHTLQVKFADADAGPPSAGAPSGLTPSDSCYIKLLPATYGVHDVQQLFEPHGLVMDVKLFPCLNQWRGASALVRMASVEAAERAIAALAGTVPAGGTQQLIVRFAESATEKAARLNRRERQQMTLAAVTARLNSAALLDGAYAGLGGRSALPADSVQQALALLQLGAHMHAPAVRAHSDPALRPADADLPSLFTSVQSSICITGLPSSADRLYLYEEFSRFGPIVGLRVYMDDASGMCSGMGVVDYGDATAAARAQQVMNGLQAGEERLQVVVGQGERLNGWSHP